MAEPSVRQAGTDAAPTPIARFEQLIESAMQLARSGAGESLAEVLREADRLLARERERLDRDGSAEPVLRTMQRRLLEVSRILETEQQRIGRDLAALAQSAQGDSLYGAVRPVTLALDRRG